LIAVKKGKVFLPQRTQGFRIFALIEAALRSLRNLCGLKMVKQNF
jgi:hypothetical protein